jgi:flagellar motor switch protein FliN/FliY
MINASRDPKKNVNLKDVSAEGSGQAAAGAGSEAGYQFSALQGKDAAAKSKNLNFILDIPLEVTVQLGRTQMLVNDLLKLGQGSVIELEKMAGETLEILANQKLVARGEVVVINEKFGIRVTEIISPMERVEKLK